MSEKISDLNFLRSFTSGKPAMMKMFIQTFLNSAEGGLEEIKRHLEDQNWTELKKSVHTLKPQLSYMGCTKLSPVIDNIETNAAAMQELDKIPEWVGILLSGTEKAIEELKIDIQSL